MLTQPLVERTPVHTRVVAYHAFHRKDRLWDIEARMTDTKSYPFNSSGIKQVEPGDPIHDMVICATLDDTLTICAINTAMLTRPHSECMSGIDPLQKLVGCTMGRGWRSTLEQHLGGAKGCTHLRELMFNMATAAFQAIPSYRTHLKNQAGYPLEESNEPPYHLGKCIAWDANGPLVAEYFPKFIGWQPVRMMK